VTGLRLAWTFFEVPRQALGAELSKDYVQRNTLHGLSSFFGWIGGAGIYWATSALFLGESYDNLEGYHRPALIQKSISGLGYIVKGSILTAVGFSAASSDVEKAAAVENLAWVFVLLGIVLPALALWIFSKYSITRVIHEQNLAELGYSPQPDAEA
jgi:Na+/melibiose symporter-like transporter